VGFTLRLYDPHADEWAIWWASKARPGVLDHPVRRSFDGGTTWQPMNWRMVHTRVGEFREAT
jgi:hypothetical protein